MGLVIFLIVYIIGVIFQYVNVHVNHKNLVNNRTDLDIIPWHQVAIAASWVGFFFLLIKTWLDKKIRQHHS